MWVCVFGCSARVDQDSKDMQSGSLISLKLPIEYDCISPVLQCFVWDAGRTVTGKKHV